MNRKFKGWAEVAEKLLTLADDRAIELNDGQAESLRELAKRLPENGVIIADEVGMGKTRIAVAVAKCVIEAGGRVAILVPPGLGYQWSEELRTAKVESPAILRSLDGYLNAWVGRDEPLWGECDAVLLSHAFCNWSLKNNTKKNWRWALLPAVLKLLTQQIRESGRVRLGDENKKKFDDSRVDAAANWIVTKGAKKHLKKLICNETINEWGDSSPLFDPANYTKHTEFRKGLECVVGIGLGAFDLVIIDEAHKSRGQESNLNRLLSQVVLQSTNSRCLAMTATPVELDETQWMQMLERIQVDEISKEAATTAISNYAQAVNSVRKCPSDEETRKKYKESAKRFKQALNPYLLRRDKRKDPAVIKFMHESGEGYHAYRRIREIPIDTAKLPSEWKQAVCAAEALSFVTRQSDGKIAGKHKRLRLTLGNGHGIAALIDQLQRDDNDDHKQTEADEVAESNTQHYAETELSTDKRLLRAEWWQNVMIQPFVNDGSALFDHPAILAAVKEIERVCQQGEKVLVFGRFTRPLRALVQLLDAREMLRCVDSNLPWPQSKVHENAEWGAILAAHQQLRKQGELDRKFLEGELDRKFLDHALADQYQALENQRSKIREKLISHIEEGFHKKPPGERAQALFDTFKKMATEVSEHIQSNADHALAVVARAIQELIGANIENAISTDFAQAFIELVAAASDRDEGDTDGDGKLDENEASKVWNDVITRLGEEYNHPEGGYARLMYGETKPATRRFLQLAFNRKHGYPKVLVAQSLVGREGLNLHKACRTVVLLHPEWNPGVVEQQIGRVDRISSLWEEKLNQAINDQVEKSDLPRIEIRLVVFKGTYDEKNWQVLQDRWEDLRAQLHGVVISPRIAEKYPNAKEVIAEINDAAPNFSPSDNVCVYGKDSPKCV